MFGLLVSNVWTRQQGMFFVKKQKQLRKESNLI